MTALLECYNVCLHIGQHVTSHTPELDEPPTTSSLGSSNQPLQPNSKSYSDDYHQQSSFGSRKVGSVYVVFKMG